VLEATVRLERAQERLLECVLCSLGPELPPEKPEHLGPMLFVEALEGRNRHAVHHHHETRDRADL